MPARITITCPQCGLEFQALKSRKAKYCSRTCANRARWDKPKTEPKEHLPHLARTCPQCNTEFQADRKEQVYCSRRCSAQARMGPRTYYDYTCQYCGKEFQSDRLNCKYCGMECSALARKTGKAIHVLTCEYCNKEFKHPDKRRRFCDKWCAGSHLSRHFSGENSPHWQGGSVRYYGPNWIEQRDKARERDGHACVFCGSNDVPLHVHHRIPFRCFEYAFGENDNHLEANRLKNLITLCVSCHASADAEFRAAELADSAVPHTARNVIP